MTWRKYLFPYRTQKSSSNVPKILVGYPAGKIGCCQFFFILKKYKLELFKQF